MPREKLLLPLFASATVVLLCDLLCLITWVSHMGMGGRLSTRAQVTHQGLHHRRQWLPVLLSCPSISGGQSGALWKICILWYLGEIFCGYLLGKFDLWCHLTPVLLWLVYIWMACQFEEVGYWNHYRSFGVNLWLEGQMVCFQWNWIYLNLMHIYLGLWCVLDWLFPLSEWSVLLCFFWLILLWSLSF